MSAGLMQALTLYVATGFITGIASGLFGIGGGLVIVPALVIALPLVGADGPHLFHIAIGTSLAIVFATSLYTTILRQRKGEILWPLVLRVAPFVALGGIGGAALGHQLSGPVLKLVFMGFVVFSLGKTLIKHVGKGNAEAEGTAVQAPHLLTIALYGIMTGISGALIGIGAALVMVPFLKRAGYRMGQATAAAAALSAMVGFWAAASHMVLAHGQTDLPPGALGYVYPPAFIGMAAGALFGSPYGITLSRRFSETAQLLALAAYLLFVLVLMMTR